MPLVSVCVPSYNHGRFLEELINSVLNQTYTDFELIICDDLSTDNSRKVMESFNDPRIQKYYNQQNLGVVANINKSISLARGKYIIDMGSDDVMLPDNLKRKVEYLEKNTQVGFIYSDYIGIDKDGKANNRRKPKNPHKDCILSKETCFIRLIQEGNFIVATSVMMRKECLDRVGLLDERFRSNQDYEMWLRLSLLYDCAYLSEPLVQYRWHDTNITHEYIKDGSLGSSLQDNLCKEVALGHYERLGINFMTSEIYSAILEGIGRDYLWINKTSMARKFLYRSLIKKKINPRVWKLFLISLLPEIVLVNLKKIKDRKK